MSLYAKINSENIVENIIICEDSNISALEGLYIKVTDQTRDAEIGFTYNQSKGYFISTKPWPSWILDENDNWVSPAGPKPVVGTYRWNEEDEEWTEVQQLTSEE